MGDEELYTMQTRIVEHSELDLPMENVTVIVDWQVSGRSGPDGVVNFKGPKGRDFLVIIYQTNYAPQARKVRTQDLGNIITNISMTRLQPFEFNNSHGISKILPSSRLIIYPQQVVTLSGELYQGNIVAMFNTLN